MQCLINQYTGEYEKENQENQENNIQERSNNKTNGLGEGEISRDAGRNTKKRKSRKKKK